MTQTFKICYVIFCDSVVEQLELALKLQTATNFRLKLYFIYDFMACTYWFFKCYMLVIFNYRILLKDTNSFFSFWFYCTLLLPAFAFDKCTRFEHFYLNKSKILIYYINYKTTLRIKLSVAIKTCLKNW